MQTMYTTDLYQLYDRCAAEEIGDRKADRGVNAAPAAELGIKRSLGCGNVRRGACMLYRYAQWHEVCLAL